MECIKNDVNKITNIAEMIFTINVLKYKKEVFVSFVCVCVYYNRKSFLYSKLIVNFV